MAPARRSRATCVESRAATWVRKGTDPYVVGRPATSSRSFTPNGRPASGPGSALRAARPLLTQIRSVAHMPDIDSFQLTREGSRREVNEDAVGCWPHADGLVLAVADGLGAHSAGEVASQLALEVLPAELAQAPTTWPLTTRLRRAVQAANVAIYQKAITVPELQGMATTLTATALVGGALVTAHVGDCRLWLFRDGALTQLTKDHTWVWAHVPGAPSVEQVRD